MAIPPHVLGTRDLLETTSRLQSRAVAFGERTLLCRVLGKYLMFADADDFSVAPHLALNGYWEAWTTLALARALQPGVHAVDVGANHGYFTLLMADAADPDGRVLAIEPNPRLAELIGRTLDVNGYSGCCAATPHAAAAASGAVTRLAVPRHRWADASLVLGRPGADEIAVETLSIDDAVHDWPCVDLIKIDAEGSEEAIWSGMEGTLRRNPGITIVMEFKAAAYHDSDGLLERIRECGFQFACIEDDGSVIALGLSQIRERSCQGDLMLFLQRGACVHKRVKV